LVRQSKGICYKYKQPVSPQDVSPYWDCVGAVFSMSIPKPF
jgi:hypothetical protein